MKTALRLLAGITVVLGVLGLLLFGAAGRTDLPFFWAYMATLLALFLSTLIAPDKDLMNERRKPGPGGRDLTLRRNMILLMSGHWILAGLDVGRWHWSDAVPAGVQIAALAGIALALCLSVWAVRTNRFFSSVARIQRDRGHRVITGGPYQYIRHPGYAAAITWLVLSGIALGSWLSVLPTAVVGTYLFLRRVRVEEELLFAELEGYREYARQVPYRFIPWVV